VQGGRTVLMIAAGKGASTETMQLLLDSGAAPTINAKTMVTHLCFHLSV
jgi:ankyrin repeat protein